MKRRVFSFVTALALCLNLCPLWAFAAEVDPQDNTGLCPHHLAHTDECGYKAPTEGFPCTHEHDKNCGYVEAVEGSPCTCNAQPDSDGNVTHNKGCGYVEAVEGSPCTHKHDGSCGYAAADPGKPCTFVCRICPINALIKKLPESATEDNAEQTGKQLDEILALYKKLSGAEQAQVDLSHCVVLRDQLEELNGESSQDRSLNSDATDSTPFIVEKTQKLYLNGHTLTNDQTAAVQVKALGVLEIIGPGTIVSNRGSGVVVETGGRLTISEDVSVTSYAEYALDIAKGEDVKLSAGTYHGCFGAIRVQDGNYTAVLENGSAFYDGGSAVLPENLGDASPLTVKQCTDHASKTYTHSSGAPTHTWTCDYCGTSETEKCTFSFNENGAGECSLCHNKLAIDVDQDALSNLVYDGSFKPTDVPVTVTLTDPDGNSTTLARSTEGTQDRDFTVDIVSIKDAGTATVTVNGVTFNGKFEKSYTVEQATPGINWSGATCSVDYDGSAVTAGELPQINITINTPTGEDLHPLLKYQYQKSGDTGFTDGLPTNAGTYKVKAYLEESQNYEAAETDPLLELTINPINPIKTAPAAKTLTYNRTAQALVTAGELNPVAIADGLKIQFATEQNGTYSDTIPTGTNAGDYTVWYQVVGLTDNYIAPDSNPAQVTGVEIQRKHITPVVTLSQYSYLYDSGYHEPTVTVIDDEDGHYVINPLDNEYTVEYVNNRNVSTDANPAKVVVTDSDPDGGNYTLEKVEVKFKITSKTQDTLSITNKPATFTYGDKFTLQTSGGSGNGLVTWEIVPADPDNPTAVAATVDANSGQVVITGHGDITVKATKSGKDPATNVVNYEDATATWTFTVDKKPVTATVTAEDKTYDGDNTATIHAVVENSDLAFPGDEITITGLTGTFDDEDAGENKTVTVVTTGATITGNNHEHYEVTYSATTVKATIHKAVAKITTAPVPANLTYDGTAQALIATGAVVEPADVPVEYALSDTGPWSTGYPEGTVAGDYTVWYRVKETDNYTGLAPASVDVTINKKPVSPTIELSGDGLQTDSSTPPTYSYIYDGTAKEPVVTLYEADGTTIIPVGEYTVAYSGNVNVGTATVTVTAKDDGNYSFTSVTKNFTINKQQATVVEAPEAAGLPLTFNTFAQRLVTAGEASGGTMVYSTDGENGTYSEDIPTETDADEYTVHYKVQGDANHSDSAVGSVKVTIAPKTVKDPTIELQNADGSALVSYTYDGNAKEPKVVVKDGSDIIGADEYNIVYSDNTDAGHGTVNITDKPNGNYTVTGSATFVINRAVIVFNPAPIAATLTYNGTAQELLVPGTTSGGTVQYALNSATSTFYDAIPTGVNAGTYNVYYKVTGDKNHNDLPVQGPVAVTIGRKPLTAPTIELTPNSFKYDGTAHLPTVTVKDGDTVLPTSEYTWKCYDASGTNEVSEPKDSGTYTITISDKAGGNYDLTGAATANKNTATFTIGKVAQEELVIEGKPEQVYYGDSFQLTASGGSGSGTITWSAVGGNADIDTNGNVTIKNVGNVTINVVKAGDTNYEQTSTQWTFTAAPKPVTAAVTVSNKPYDGNTTATVASANIDADLVTGDTVSIDPTSIKATFDNPHAGADKTVTLDTSKVQVTGDDAAKYAISYPATVTAEITKATTTITTAPEKIDPLTYNEQPQALITAGQTNVGFLVYSLSENGEYSTAIPAGTNAGDYTVYYKVDGTADYTGVTGGPINVAIAQKNIKDTVKIELSETSYVYDSAKKSPKVTLKDGDTVIPESQYEVTWANDDPAITEGLLTAVGTYRATITNVTGGNYIIDNTAEVHITPATQASLHITGQPEHVYYGDTVTTLNTTGGTGEGTLKWSVTAGGNVVTIDESTGVLTAKGVGAFTVKAERSVPNYGTAADSWTFTVEPKPVTAAVTVQSKDYDGGTTATVASVTVPTINGDTVTVELTSITATFDDPNVGTGKPVTLSSTGATVTGADANKYAVSYPATAKGDIKPKNVTVSITLSDHDLKTDANGQYYDYDGTEKEPTVKVTADDGSVLTTGDYSVNITNNKNVGDATVTVTAKDGGNYTFNPVTVNFEIRSAAAELTSSPQAKDLTYEKGTQQELVTVGTASGGTVVYALKAGNAEPADSDYSENIPKGENAGTYTVYYMVKGDSNHESTAPQQMTATIKPKEITPTIALSGDGLTETNGVYSYTYDGTAKTPTVTVKDGTETINATEYTVSYRDNINAGTATVTVSNNNGGNYIVNGAATFEITKAAPTLTQNPVGKTSLQYTAGPQDLLEKLGVADGGMVVYSLDGVNYAPTMPTATAVATHTVYWKVEGDANHSDIAPARFDVKIDKCTVKDPTITLSSAQFTYDGNQHRPEVTVTGNNGQLIDPHEYTVSITPDDSNNTSNLVDVGTYTVTVAAAASSNYEFQGGLTATYKIVEANQTSITITGNPAQVTYGDSIQLAVTGGTGEGTLTWTVADGDGNPVASTISTTGLLTVKDVETPVTVTVKRTLANHADVTAAWTFTAAKKPVTAVLTGVDRDYIAGNKSATVKAKVEASDLVFGDTFSIPDLRGTFDSENVGTNKTITITDSAPTITDLKAANYDITYPATTTASILAVAATVDRAPGDVTPSLTYDASQSQALVTAGAATGGTMVYSLDGGAFSPDIPKAKDAGTYTIKYKVQGDRNHTDSAEGAPITVNIAAQSVTEADLQIDLSPSTAVYDKTAHYPEVTLQDKTHNVIPDTEYTVTYVADSGKNWTDAGSYTVRVTDAIANGGNYEIAQKDTTFEITMTDQGRFEIINKPGVVTYGDSFTLGTTEASGTGEVTWESSDEGIATVDENGLVTILGVGEVTITAKKAADINHSAATATYSLNAQKKVATLTFTADNKPYDGTDTATIHPTWTGLVGTDANSLSTSNMTGTFGDTGVGVNKTVTITGDPTGDAARKYEFLITRTTTASITKAAADAPKVAGKTGLTYTGTPQALVTDSSTDPSKTLYCATENGVYTENVPTGTNAGEYTVWYKTKGDANHTDSAPQGVTVTISAKALNVAAASVELTGNGLQKDGNDYYYEYDGAEKTPAVVIKDGSEPISTGEYTVTYTNNRDAGPATVTITDKAGGNYTVTVDGTVSFTIKSVAAILTGAPQDRGLTYRKDTAQELVTVGTATGGHIEYKLTSAPADETPVDPNASFSTRIPTGTNAGAYTVDYKVVGDGSYSDGPSGTVAVTIQPKTVVSPKIAVNGGPFAYTGNALEPTVTVMDGADTIGTGEYTLSYRDNVNAGTATVVVSDNSGGNYTVNGTAEFTIGKAEAKVDTPPEFEDDADKLAYTGEPLALLKTAGTATGGTLVYALSKTGTYSAAIPTGKAVGKYRVWYMVQGDANHNSTEATELTGEVEITKRTVTDPLIQVTPESVTYNGLRQTPTVTVKVDGVTLNGSEYNVTYTDIAGNTVTELKDTGTYTVTITGVTDGNYIFDAAGGKNTATYTILPADQTPLTITGTRERVYYGDAFPLGTNGSSGGTVKWSSSDTAVAAINKDTGRLTITGVGDVTVTVTCERTGYNDQIATWPFHADQKPVTATVTAGGKEYNGDTAANVTATLQDGDFVGTDSFTITLTGCTFEDANAGENKTVTVVSTNPSFTASTNPGSTDNHENYSITYPATVTASITKADIPTDKVTAPAAEVAANLVYTGQPLALVTAGSVEMGYGTLEYSLDGLTYSASLPTGTNAGDYDVWYRVKGDGNHNDVDGKKLGSVTITAQTVTPIIEFTPNQATYNGQEQKPSVTVKDAAGRVIPDTEYTVAFSDTGWTAVSVANTMEHTVTVTDKAGGNYTITETAKEFTILPAGQDPLSIMNQPGTVYYGTDFTLSVTGGSGAGTVSWSSDKTGIASIDQNGKVTVHQAGGPVTITATRTAAGHTAATATWTFSAEKKPVTAIITASDKVYNGDKAATLTIDWNLGDVLTADVTALTNDLANALTGTFGSAGVGDNKTVTIALKTGIELPDGGSKYAVSFNRTTTASITPAASSVTPPTPVNPEYTGKLQDLVTPGSATNGTIQYSTDGIVYGPAIPQGKDADTYRVWYKVVGSENYKDSDPVRLNVTIQPKTPTNLTIELSPETFEYDGTAKKPDVTVKDGSTVIPASEYTVRYSNNVNKGTATVTISDNAGGNYTVSGSRNFTITAGAASLVSAPQPNNRTYDGTAQPLVTAGTAVNGKVVYSLTQGSGYGPTIPSRTDADTYTVWYKVQGENGGADTTEDYVMVTIASKPITPTVLVGGQSSYSVTYTGSAQTPAVTVIVDGKPLTQNVDYTALYSNNTNVGTATVTIQSTGGNYQFYLPVTFEITKAKATFAQEPRLPVDNLYYTGEPQELVRRGTANNGGIVLYSLDNVAYSTAIPTGIDRGSYTVFAKVQANDTYAESDVVTLDVEIGKNVVTDTPDYDLSATSFPYTGSEVQPTVTLWDDDGYEIDSSEYTLRYSNNIAVGTATIKVTCKRNGNYSFNQFSITFQIVDASQTPLAITGKQDPVYYGDTLSLGVTGGGSGAVTWSSNSTDVATIDGSGVVSIKKSGSVTITATKGGSTDAWTFYAKPKPVTATVYAADKVYDGTNTVNLTVTLSGLVSGDNVATNTEDGVKATGQFTDTGVGTRTVIITLTVPAAVSEKYNISCNNTTTASITPKPASVTGSVTRKSLTYNGTAQALIEVNGVTVEGGNLAYSLDGNTYTLRIPTATEVGSYPVWYKVVAGDENHKDSAPVQVTPTPQITANPNAPKSVQCSPGSLPYDGTVKTPEVVVLDSTGTHIIPASEYTVSFSPSLVRDVGKYSVTVTDKPGGSYEFTAPVTVANAFEIVASSQAPVSITDKPGTVRYGDTFYLSATGGTGGGKIVWDIESTGTAPATITQDGAVTVNDVGTFTVKAYREASGGYSVSNTDTVTFTARPKVVTPVVTAEDKTYDGKTDATLTATVKSTDLVNSGDKVDLTVTGAFASPDAGTGKRVDLGTCTVAGAAKDKYTINWPDYVTATINRVDAKISGVPTGKTLTYNGSPQELVSAGTTENSIGTVVYSLNDQNGTYSADIPKATDAGTYTVWYKVADSVNYNGVPAAAVKAEIKAASTPPVTPPSEDTSSDTGTGISSDTLSTYSTPARTTVRNGAANTVLSTSEGASLVRQAAANQSQSVVIKPEIVEGETVTKTAVSIPASTASQLNSQTNAALTVSAPIADVTIPNAALDTLGSAGGTVDVVTEQVGDAVKLTLSAGGETVESVPGGVTLTVPVEDATPGTVAVLVGEDGTRQVIQKSVAKDGAVSVPLDGSATVEIVDNSKTFEDISSEDWESDAVAFASARELFVGTGGDSFEPETQMSRSMLAEVLYRLEGSPAVEDSASGDDSGSKPWYADSAAWATEKGITDSGFDPNEAVTREQFALMLWRYAGKPQTGEENADQTGSDAQKALLWATEKGVLIGRSTEEQQIDPEDPVTRAEAVQMVKNFLEKS